MRILKKVVLKVVPVFLTEIKNRYSTGISNTTKNPLISLLLLRILKFFWGYTIWACLLIAFMVLLMFVFPAKSKDLSRFKITISLFEICSVIIDFILFMYNAKVDASAIKNILFMRQPDGSLMLKNSPIGHVPLYSIRILTGSCSSITELMKLRSSICISSTLISMVLDLFSILSRYSSNPCSQHINTVFLLYVPFRLNNRFCMNVVLPDSRNPPIILISILTFKLP